MYTLARFLQAVGLVLLPLALFHGISQGEDRQALMTELAIMAVGAVLFVLGRRLEQRVSG